MIKKIKTKYEPFQKINESLVSEHYDKKILYEQVTPSGHETKIFKVGGKEFSLLYLEDAINYAFRCGMVVNGLLEKSKKDNG